MWRPLPHPFNLVGCFDGECALMGLHPTFMVTKCEDSSILEGNKLKPLMGSRIFLTLSSLADGGITQTL